jgi:uncharacterized membrane protein YvlD (DUF360 family)
MVKSWLGSIFFVILNVVEAAILSILVVPLKWIAMGLFEFTIFYFFLLYLKLRILKKKYIYFEIIFGWLGNLRQNWKKIGYNFNII